MSVKNTTVCALSTPQGIGAIAIIRVTGPDAFTFSASLFSKKVDFLAQTKNVMKLAEVMDGEQLIDQVMVVKYEAPHSYTGENMVEISCHGSFFIRKKILELLLQSGCHSAAPGEFTMRAFLNGKLDLPQAEAVADLIDSQTESAHRLAINQLRGNVSKKLEELRQQFLDLASLLELELDFSEEEVEFADRTQLKTLLNIIRSEIEQLIASFKLGNNLKNGIPVVIAGRPNVGKSTLLNALLDEERAIVSDIPGTTRDTVEDTLTLQGTTFRFIDTAGIHSSEDTIEKFGIERSFKAMEKADVILYLFDASTTTQQQLDADFTDWQKETDWKDKTIFLIGNKIDKVTKAAKLVAPNGLPLLYLSAKNHEHLQELEKRLVEATNNEHIATATLLTNTRHYDSMLQIRKDLLSIEQGINDGLSTDLIAIDVHSALEALGTITGTIANQDILNNIFGRFCIGK
ncbi:MAG: tRNA uridine-5-carboxymethylaminomethyl(34) synthesis GTPase MnmE [Bacteroidales bacterium]|nr:tRNA uridine-5-carboxymethylaminomethyl(34) synthesis GTPase MnmE [Bacteroidales bacterium]